MRHAVVVTAAGSSSRFNKNSDVSRKKEFVSLNGHSVLYNAVLPFVNMHDVCAVVVTYKAGTREQTEQALEGLGVILVEGGSTRQQSVFNALSELYSLKDELKPDFVSIHDGARPYITEQLIKDTMKGAEEHGACAPVLAISDTVVKVDDSGFINSRIDRNEVRRIQTPQVFRFPEIYDAHRKASEKTDKLYTDDTEIYSDFVGKVFTVPGSADNIKITFACDVAK